MNHFAAQFRSQLNEGERDPSTTRRAFTLAVSAILLLSYVDSLLIYGFFSLTK